MNYTPNHHLPQWVESDRVRMEDFNDAMSRIESGMTANASAAAELPYRVGYYTGDGTSRRIELGFTPSFLIISGMRGSTDADYAGNIHYFVIAQKNNGVEPRVQITLDGFHIYPVGNYDLKTPDLNEKGRHYGYIAFK